MCIFQVNIYAKIIILVSLFNIVQAQDSVSCGIGCICALVNESLECQSCMEGFQFNSDLKNCSYQLCDIGLVGYQNLQYNPPKMECLAICPKNNKPNIQKNVCEVTQNCSQTYKRKTAITNSKTATGFGIYKDNYIVVLYDTFLNIINKITGNFEKQINYQSDVIRIKILDGQIYIIQGTHISIWDIEKNEINLIGSISCGSASKSSYLIQFSDQIILYSTQDTDNQKFYINAIDLSQSQQPQSIGLDMQQKEIKILNDNVLVTLTKQQKLQIQIIKIQNQQIQLTSFMKEETFCYRDNGDQISLLGSVEFFLKLGNDKYVVSFTLESSLFILNQASNKCVIAIANTKPLKMIIITLQAQKQTELLLINVQNYIKVYSTDFQLLQQISIASTLNDMVMYQFFSNGKLNLKLYALQTKGKIDIFESQYENSFNFTQTQSLQLKIYEPLKVYILNSTNDQKPVLYAANYYFTSIDIQTNIINYNVADLDTNYTPHRTPITSLQLTTDLKILVTTSNDGTLIIWNFQNKFSPVIYYIFNEIQENCSNTQIFLNRYIFAQYASKIIILDIYNPTSYIPISIKSILTSVLISSTDSFVLINSDGCLQFYDINIQFVFKTCDNKYNSLSNALSQKNNLLVIRQQNLIQILLVDLLNKQLTIQKQYSHTSKIGLFKIRQYSGSKLFSIIFIDELLYFNCFNNQMQSQMKIQISSTSIPLDFNFPANTDQEDYFLLANTTDVQQIYKYQIYQLSNNFQSPKFINSLSYLTNIYSIFADKQSDGEDVFRIPVLMPFFSVSLILQFSYSSNSGRIESGIYPLISGQLISKCIVFFDQRDWMSICGAYSGFVGFTKILKPNYYQVYKGIYQTTQQISGVNHSLTLERYFIQKGSVLIYNLHSDELEEEIIFQDTNNPIKEVKLNESLKVITFIKDNEIQVRNYNNSNHFYKNDTGLISGVLLDEIYKRIITYGNNINIYTLTQQNQQSQILTSTIASKCIQTQSLIICKLIPYKIIFYDRKTLIQGITITISSYWNTNFNINFDEANNILYVYYNFVMVYNLAGQLTKMFLQVFQPLVEFNFYGDKIVLSDSIQMYIYDRQTQNFLLQITSDSAATIKKTLYIPSQNILCFYTNVVRSGQVQFYSLSQLRSLGTYTNSINPKYGDMVNMINDDLNQELHSIDVLGNINEIGYKYSFAMDNSLQLQHLFASDKPSQSSLEFDSNSIFIGNQQNLYRLNYNTFLQTIYTYYKREVKYATFIKIGDTNYSLLFDKYNILYQYANYQQIYLTEYQDQVLDIFSLPQNSYFVVAFKSKLIVYQGSKQENQDRIVITQVRVISGYLYRSLVCSIYFLTYDQKIVDYDFISGIERSSVSLQSQLDIITQRVCVTDINLIVFGFFSGKIIIYDRLKYSIKEVQNNLFTNQPIKNILYVNNTITLCQQNGDFVIISLLNFEMQKIQKSDYTKVQTDIILSAAVYDGLNKRYYVWFQNQKKLNVLNDKFKLIKYISFPNDENYSIFLGKDISILYCSFQLNIYDRSTLQFLFSIRRFNRQDEIRNINYLDEKYLVIVFLHKVEIYLIDKNQKPQYQLIDKIEAQFSNQILLQFLYDPLTTKEVFLEFIGYSMNSIFERRISVDLVQSNQNYCVSSIIAQNKLQVEQQFNAIYSSASNLNFTIYFEIDKEIEIISQISNNTVDYIFTSKQNQLASNSTKQLILSLKTFNLIKKSIKLQDFDLTFFSKGDYVISQESQIVVFQNIIIKNQDLRNIKLKFQSMNSITFNKLNLSDVIMIDEDNQKQRHLDQGSFYQNSNSDIKNQLIPFIEIDDTQQVIIIDLIIKNITFHQPYLLFKITNSQSVFIKNCYISNSQFSSLFYFQNLNNIKIQNIIIQDNQSIVKPVNLNMNIYAFIILGSQYSQFFNVTIKDNHDIFFIYTSKTQQSSNKIIILTDDELSIKSMILENNEFTKSSIDLQSMMTISNSQITIEDLKSDKNESNIQLQSCNSIKISSSQFQQNSAQNGGGLNVKYISESIAFENCKFNFNKAFSSGGAIYFYEVVQLQIDNKTEIISNSALIGGGIRYVEDKIITQLQISPQSQIIQNKAEIFGSNVIGFPTNIELNLRVDGHNYTYSTDLNQTQGELPKIQMKDFQSGGLLSILLRFKDNENNFMSIKKQKIENDIYPKDIITELQNYSFQLFPIDRDYTLLSEESIANTNQYDEVEQGIFKKDLQVSANLKSKQSIQLKIQNKDKNNVHNIDIEIEYRSCQQGEILKKINDKICNCQACPNGFYSIIDYSAINTQNLNQFENNQCKKCPDSAVSCEKSEIQLKNGFWRLNNYTDEILSCSNNENNCIPENSHNKYGCLEGHVGPLCEQCDSQGKVWKEHYTNSIGFLNCSKCSSFGFQITYILIISILLLVYLFVQLLLFMNGFVHTQTCFYLRKLNLLPISASSVRGQSNFYMKILMNYFQISAITLNFKIKLLPDILVFGTNIFGNTVGSIAIDANCLYPQKYQDELGQGRLRQITQTMISPLYYIFLLIFLEIFQRLNLYQIKNYHKYTLSCFLFLFFQPDSLTLYSKSLTCRQIGSISVYSQDMNYSCDDYDFSLFVKIFTLSNLIIWILLPLIPFYQIIKHQKQLNCCNVRFKLGYFYSEFKEKYFFWEFIRIYLRVLIVIVFTFLQQSVNVAIIITNLAIFFYIYCIVKIKPFQSFKLQKYEKFSYFTLIVLMSMNALNKTYSSIVIEIFYTLINYFFIMLITGTIIMEKINNRHNLIGKCFQCFFIKCVPKKYSYLFQVRSTNIKTYFKWKKIKNNLIELQSLKAIGFINDATKQKLDKQNSIQSPNYSFQTMVPHLLHHTDQFKLHQDEQYSDINSAPQSQSVKQKMFDFCEEIKQDEIDEFSKHNDIVLLTDRTLQAGKKKKIENDANNIDESQQFQEDDSQKSFIDNRRISSMSFKLGQQFQSNQRHSK